MPEQPPKRGDDDLSRIPGAPQGYPIRRGPDLPEGVEEPGEVPTIDELSELVEPTSSDIYTGDLEAEGAAAGPRVWIDGHLDLELRPDETTDPIEATEEGLAYVPPIDPVVSGVEDDGDPIVATGFAPDALSEPYDASHHSTLDLDEEEMVERVRDALRADAMTTAWAEDLEIAVVGDRVAVGGIVPDLVDADAVVAVIERVTGVREVADHLVVEAADRPSRDVREPPGR